MPIGINCIVGSCYNEFAVVLIDSETVL